VNPLVGQPTPGYGVTQIAQFVFSQALSGMKGHVAADVELSGVERADNIGDGSRTTFPREVPKTVSNHEDGVRLASVSHCGPPRDEKLPTRQFL
jgi:hypothetical protein